jgi:UDP-N-acetylglucosamine diphosphorylase/glucosamine-1-phosphate N-acetyltransferase
VTPWLVLFEDARWSDLAPLTDVLPVPALAYGDSHLARRWLRAMPDSRLLAVEARRLPMAAWREAPALDAARPDAADLVLAVNAAALPGSWLAAALEGPGSARWTAGDRVIGARLPFRVAAEGLGSGERFEAFLRGLELPDLPVEARAIRWPWEIVEWSPEALAADLERERPEQAGAVDRLAAVYEPGRVSVGPAARVDAYAVLDARPGPIRLGPRARVAAHTLITGPCVVGEATELLGGVVGRSTLGPECRLAGEVDSSVWQGYANKRHHGFVGHSVVSEWVNLGALTTTSDLKNTYGQVRVWAGGREVDTGYHKIGSFIGAHVKTGIGTLLPTGAALGTGSNLFGGGRFAPKHVPAFTWWDGERAVEHRFDRFLETARIAMARRGRPMDPADEQALEAVFEAASRERAGAVGSAARRA